MTIQHQRVLTPTCQTIQTLSAPTTVHAMQQVPVSTPAVLSCHSVWCPSGASGGVEALQICPDLLNKQTLCIDPF